MPASSWLDGNAPPREHPMRHNPFTGTELSQTPYPFSPQPFPPGSLQYQIPNDPLGPARRAGVMLLVLGGLVLLAGVCGGVMAAIVPFDQIPIPPELNTAHLPPGLSIPQAMRNGCLTMCKAGLPTGICLLVLGYFTRKGARWASISGIVVCGLLLLYTAGIVLVAMALGAGNPQNLGSLFCITIVPGGLLTLALVWLIQALRRFPAIQYAQQQYQMQMWQYQQQQAAYQQQPQIAPQIPPAPNDPWQRGYGLTPPPPPPNQPPPP